MQGVVTSSWGTAGEGTTLVKGEGGGVWQGADTRRVRVIARGRRKRQVEFNRGAQDDSLGEAARKQQVVC
jgi:hypothetical protein